LYNTSLSTSLLARSAIENVYEAVWETTDLL